MRKFYEEVWDDIQDIIVKGIPPITSEKKIIFPFNKDIGRTLELPETKYEIKFSPLDYSTQTEFFCSPEGYIIEDDPDLVHIGFDTIDMSFLQVELSLIDLMYMEKEKFIEFCLGRFRELLEDLVYRKYNFLTIIETKQTFLPGLNSGKSVYEKIVDWKLAYPWNTKSGKKHLYEVVARVNKNGKTMISIPLTPKYVMWLKSKI